MSKSGKILVGMSGGVDSTVTALLLHEQGYEVIGITLNILDYNYTGERVKNPCCSIESIMGAKEIADFIGFKHYIVDVKNEFQHKVIDKFVDEYMSGRTPNPCIRCNSDIKWGEMLVQADKFGCEKIATGHYANIKEKDGRFFLSKGKDNLKDQTYFLWALDQNTLSRTVFPLGNLTKPEVRSIAFTRGHTQIAHKQENFDICFVPDNDYRLFLKERDPGLEEKYEGGNFVDIKGKFLGKHKGYMNYTIGQRKGLGIALGKPAYVIAIDAKTNTVVIGDREKLNKNGLFIKETNMMKYEEMTEPKEVSTMVRYKSPGIESKISKFNDNSYEITFEANVQGIAPGQSAVFYEGDDVVGGGIIDSSF
ncbi:MAG TPA: tRNA 2-thiouridine(34) synthase MnmA [Bacteroidetes bacterium]|nr:tRNA 2-thiouridine(34) synthase MnmA [Bacteroidota bacterium]